jgi:hypothetical protein
VLDLVSHVRNVVLMNVYLDLENPGGSGFWSGGYMSQVREMGKFFLYVMYFSYLIGPPPTPVRASQARWVGVQIHIILLGMVGK